MLVIQLALTNQYNRSSILGDRYLSGLVCCFRALKSMHIPSIPCFYLEKEWGPIREVLGMIQPLLRHSSNCFMTLASSTGDIVYYLLEGGTESGSRSILCLMALPGGVPGFSKTSLNLPHINSQHEGSVLGTSVLSHLVSSNE